MGQVEQGTEDYDWERSLAVLQDEQAIDVAAKALACAFGVSSSMSVPLTRWSGADGEPNPDRGATLSLCRRGRVQQSASGYLPEGLQAREKALQLFKPADRDAIVEFDGVAEMRAPGSKSRTRQMRAWNASKVLVATPATRPSRFALHALVDAHLDGPLEAWLLLYSTGKRNCWETVSLHMAACGHPDWAAREAATRLMGNRRPFREVAKEVAKREAYCRSQVMAAERRLMNWLSRASRSFVRAMGAALYVP